MTRRAELTDVRIVFKVKKNRKSGGEAGGGGGIFRIAHNRARTVIMRTITMISQGFKYFCVISFI
jgi:hypothetical protein